MTAHDHREFVEGCFRCDLSRAETATVSADERVAAVLAQHRALIVYSTSLLACSCTVARHSDAPRFTEAEHVAHVAAALAPVLTEAWDEGYLHAVEPGSDIRDNPYQGGTA